MLKWIVAFCFLITSAYASEWTVHTGSIHNYEVKFKNLTEEIEHLIQEKNTNQNSTKIKHIVNDLISKHKQLQQVYKDYREEMSHIRFQHPERGDKGERQYTPLKLRSLDEIETDMGIESKMNKAMGAVRKKYGSYKKEKKTEKPVETKSDEPTDHEDFEKLKLVK